MIETLHIAYGFSLFLHTEKINRRKYFAVANGPFIVVVRLILRRADLKLKL